MNTNELNVTRPYSKLKECINILEESIKELHISVDKVEDETNDNVTEILIKSHSKEICNHLSQINHHVEQIKYHEQQIRKIQVSYAKRQIECVCNQDKIATTPLNFNDETVEASSTQAELGQQMHSKNRTEQEKILLKTRRLTRTGSLKYVDQWEKILDAQIESANSPMRRARSTEELCNNRLQPARDQDNCMTNIMVMKRIKHFEGIKKGKRISSTVEGFLEAGVEGKLEELKRKSTHAIIYEENEQDGEENCADSGGKLLENGGCGLGKTETVLDQIGVSKLEKTNRKSVNATIYEELEVDSEQNCKNPATTTKSSMGNMRSEDLKQNTQDARLIHNQTVAYALIPRIIPGKAHCLKKTELEQPDTDKSANAKEEIGTVVQRSEEDVAQNDVTNSKNAQPPNDLKPRIVEIHYKQPRTDTET